MEGVRLAGEINVDMLGPHLAVRSHSMATTADVLLPLKFEAGTTVDRQAVHDIAGVLGLKETSVIHYALARLRDSIFLDYPANTSDLSESALCEIRETNRDHEDRFKPTASLLDGL